MRDRMEKEGGGEGERRRRKSMKENKGRLRKEGQFK